MRIPLILPLLAAGGGLSWTGLPSVDASPAPLRVFIRAGAKTHGPNQHDHPRFLADWKRLLNERGAQADGALEFPTAKQLEATDVLVIYAADGMRITGEERAAFERFLQRGGGVVVIHDGVVSGDEHAWAKQVIGGAWRWDLPKEQRTKWYEGKVGIYFVDTEHPITRGLSNFDWQDEIYYDLDMDPQVRVLATCFENIHILAPQLWTVEKRWAGGTRPYRAFVSLPGHEYDVFNTVHYRVLLLRGIAWAGHRSNVNELCLPGEITERALRYPAGGPTPPEEAHKKLNVHPEFDISLVASEPLVEKVISLDWDPQGRLWVAETPEYPGGRTIHPNDAPTLPYRLRDPEKYRGRKEPRPARDRVSWLEDTDGDGRMDRKHIFADKDHGVPDGIELITSLVFYRDGVIIEAAPDIFWLRDTDKDGVCDKVEKLYTGFGTRDSHAVINNMRWGLDGWVYSAIGYSAGHPRSPDGQRDFGRVTAGVIRFKPDGSALEQVVSGSCNTWGFDFGPDGEMFYTTATCGQHFLHIVMPDRILARGSIGGLRGSWVAPDHQEVAPAIQHKRQPYLQVDWVGKFTATAGCCLYNGGAWPDRFTGSHTCSDPTVHIVHQEFLFPHGTTYVARKEKGREKTEFIAGKDLWFRPIHTRVGPDGALYVVDFYNQAVLHNDTRGPKHGANNAATRPDRDHHFARIWRVQHKQAHPAPMPALAKLDAAGLVEALQHPNGWVRDTAARLLREHPDAQALPLLRKLLGDFNAPSHARMAALYTLEALGQLEDELLLEAVNDSDPVLRKNALRIAAERGSNPEPDPDTLRARLNDSDPRARLWALIALGTCPQSSETARAVIEVWPDLRDPYLQSAALGIAANDPLLFLETALADAQPEPLVSFVQHVVRIAAQRQDAALARGIVLAAARTRSDALARAALESLSAHLRSKVAPAWTAELQGAFRALLARKQGGLVGAALPLIARWDKDRTLAEALKPWVNQLDTQLDDANLPEARRVEIATHLLGVHSFDAGIIPRVAGLIEHLKNPDLQRRLIEALSQVNAPSVARALLAAYSHVSNEVREPIFGALVQRASWAMLTLQALSSGDLAPTELGPLSLHRLRTHPDPQVAKRAAEVIASLRGATIEQKNALIARLLPAVTRPGGNLEHGHKVFLDNCGQCHAFQGEGRDLAPDLTGMGAHGRAELLVHIIDPNRMAEPNFKSVSIETSDDFAYDGIIERENRVELVLRNATGDYTIRKDRIVSRRASGLSLMPEGFEALGADALRDLLAYLCAKETRYRIVELADACTANTGGGIYSKPENVNDAPAFRKHGLVHVEEVPFYIISPQKALANVIVLKGGDGYARTMPQKVEIKVGVPAVRLHFLSGIGGWAWPIGGDAAKGQPVVKATLHFTDGVREEMIFRNGVEFADWIRRIDVPGSKAVMELVTRGQLRWFSKPVRHTARIERITLESFNNRVAPTFVAITAELPETDATETASASPTSTAGTTDGTTAKRIRTLIVGGGSAHDFKRWFDQADQATLQADRAIETDYTDQPARLPELLPAVDVLIQSSNQPWREAASRRALFDFVRGGKGMVLLHAGLWYNWRDWPEYNAVLCGGGARGHDRLGPFEVRLTEVGRTHPLTRGLPARFTITDELYWFEPDPKGTPITVLATAHSPRKQKEFPIVFVVNHPKARIAATTLGHDGQAHGHPAYQRLLRNAVHWVSGR